MIRGIDTAYSYETESIVDAPEYRDRLRDGAEAFLFHPALERLFVACEATGRISAEELEELARAQHDRSQYAALAAEYANKAMNQRVHPHMERYYLNDAGVSNEFCEAIKRAGRELMMCNEVTIPDEDFEIAAVLGATAGPVASRTNYLYDNLAKGRCRAKLLVGLGAERPVSAPDLDDADIHPYVYRARVETHLLSFAAQDWFVRAGYDMPVVDRSLRSTSRHRDQNYGSDYCYQTVSFGEDQHKPDWAPETIINVSAPYNKSHHPRANTGETIRFMSRLAHLEHGDKVLFVSHQPYLLGQKFEIERLCLESGIHVTVAGHESCNRDLPATVWGCEIAKAAVKANELLAELRRREEKSPAFIPHVAAPHLAPPAAA